MTCAACGTDNTISSLFSDVDAASTPENKGTAEGTDAPKPVDLKLTSMCCSACDEPFGRVRLHNTIALLIKKFIDKHYEGFAKCK